MTASPGRGAVVRLSGALVRTAREVPSDAGSPGQGQLLRSGLVRRGPGAAAGVAWLPLGLAVLARAEALVATALGGGAAEVALAGAPSGPAAVGALVAELCRSHRDLPVRLRRVVEEPATSPGGRARLLVGRGRRWEVHHADLDAASVAAEAEASRAALVGVLDGCGLAVEVVALSAGGAGGDDVVEALVWPTPAGADRHLRCGACGCAVGPAAVPAVAPAPGPVEGRPAAEVVDTPGTPTIATLVDHLNARPAWRRADGPWTAAHTLKNVVVRLLRPDGAVGALAVGLPGDREVDLDRLDALVAPAEVAPFTDEDFAAHPTLARGYLGPGVLGEGRASGIRYLLDPRVVPGSAWVSGADVVGRHVLGLVCGRDFEGDGVADVAEVVEGDPCPRCGGALAWGRGVELARLTRSGAAGAERLGLSVQGRDGRPAPVALASVEVGLQRLVAAVAEVAHDGSGLRWPPALAPADVHVVVAGKDEAQVAAAEALAAEVAAAGRVALLDDRPGLSPGVRFADADLLGVPSIVVVGRGLARGVLEVRDRRSGERADVPLAEVAAALLR